MTIPDRLVCAVLGALVVAVYLPSLDASFQFDDWNVIVGDPRVQSVGAWWRSMPGIRPLTKLTYAINHQFGHGPAGFRAVNVLVHLIGSVLVWCLVRGLARALGWTRGEAVWSATWMAAVFAVHPVQTEAVTYVSGRSGALAACLALASAVAWFAGSGGRVSGAGPVRQSSRAAWLVSALCFVLAMAAKETAVVLPLALLLLARLSETPAAPDRASAAGQAGRSRALWLHGVLAGVALAAVLTWPPYRALILTSLGTRSAWENLLTQTRAWPFLLGELVAGPALNADPGLAPLVTPTVPAVLVLAFALLAVGWAVVSLAGGRRTRLGNRAVAAGVLWTAIWLAPTNSLLARLDVANDRQWYLAILGPAWLVACAVRGGLRPLSDRHRVLAAGVTGAVAVGLVAALAGATVVRNRVYDTEVTFWTDVVQRSPANARAAGNLGYALVLACRDADAERWLRTARRLDPADVKAAVNLRLLRAGAFASLEGRRCPPE